MKILQVINSLATGGAEKLLLDTLPLYRKAGIEMDVLLLWDNNQPFTEALKALNCCKVMILNESDNYRDIYALSNIFKLRTYLKEYDIAHVHLFPSLYFVVLANFINGNSCKLVFTEHSTSNRRIRNPFFRIIDSFFYIKYTRLIAINEDVKSALNVYKLNKLNFITIILNGVDVAKYITANGLNKKNIDPKYEIDNRYIVQVSSFHEPKDHITLVQSLKYLPDHIKLILVGKGILESRIKKYVEYEKLNSRVIFLGQRMDVPQILKTADVVVLSSKYEGLSLSSIEGMASGKPFLASNVPGLRDVVEGAGVLFEQGNAEELASKIIELMQNVKLYSQVEKACQERAKQYDIRVMVEKHIRLYNEIILLK